MKALVWHGKEDIRCDTVSDPEIEHERDAIITLLDYMAAQDVGMQHDPKRGRKRDYSNRTGFPKGLAAVKGAALPQPASASVT